jgi:DNA polymerase I-like protein with 3'-5' exonuclease and polymerase domains
LKLYKPSDIENCVTLDFESERIQSRPTFPPKPVGLAVRYPDAESEYFAWGHPSGNNCSLKDVRRWMVDLWRSDAPLLFFNAKFDLSIAYEVLDLPRLPWERIHDAMFLAFLADPHARNLDLKSLADYILDWPPEEKDAIAIWVWEHRHRLTTKYGHKVNRRAKSSPPAASNSGEWLAFCPASVVDPYAVGDVDRTHGLFEHLYPLISENNMIPAYERELRVLPIFMENEENGMRVDLEMLETMVPKLRESLAQADDHLRTELESPDLNIDADAQLAEALSRNKIIADEDWTLTPSGQKSVSKVNLKYEMFLDEDIGHLLFYRNKLTTALGTFLEPWLEQASQRDGYISTNWNQVRGEGGGTRTGRPSTNKPNLLNVPKMFDETYNMAEGNIWDLEELPFVRDYVEPDEDEVFIHRDFDGQEMRVFAHYESGSLLEAYQNDPKLDPHAWVGEELENIGVTMQRTHVKNMNFLGLYGGGAPAAALQMGMSLTKAKEYLAFHKEVLPGKDDLNEVIREMVAVGEPIRTWGGRVYYPEPATFRNGRKQDNVFKLINVLCQGSAADITKEALIRYHEHPKKEARFLITVYDEINSSSPKGDKLRQMRVLKESMESVSADLDLEMTTSGKMGPRWGKLEKCA